jgi:hypothetical protein
MTSGIGHVSQPLDISIAHMKSHLAHIQHISIIHLPHAGEGNDAPQITSRGVFSVGGSRRSELFSRRLPAIAAAAPWYEMWRSSPNGLLRRCGVV